MATKKDQDKADEGAVQAPDVNATTRTPARIKGAYQLGGAWFAADGSTLTPQETQAAHRAMDAAAAEARRKAMLGGAE